MAQLYLDECVPLSLAQVFAQDGYDVTSAMELGLRGRNDPFHLKYATEQRRTLVTTNQSDFRLLHRFWSTMRAWEILHAPHQGILATAILQLDERLFAAAIVSHLSQQQTIIGTFWMWNPTTGWHADKW